MKIIILRHAESQANKDMFVSSKIPGVDLSINGIEQAKKIGKELSEKFNFDIIYTSPFLRTSKTSSIINEYLNVKYIIPDIRISDMYFGLFDEKSKEEIEPEMKNFNERILKGDYSMRFGEIGESEYSFRDRLFSFLIELGLRQSNETILVVTHGMTGGVLQEMINNYQGHISLKNATYAEVEFSKERLKDIMNERADLYKNLTLQR